MRREFAKQLFDLMAINNDIFVITADLGYGMFDKIRDTYKDRFYNVGAAEQSAVGVAIGLAMSGKIPIVYSITPFLLFRPFELIRNYLSHEQIPVVLIGGGRDNDYSHDGFSHYAGDDEIIKQLNICFIKEDTLNLKQIIELKKPCYVNLKR